MFVVGGDGDVIVGAISQASVDDKVSKEDEGGGFVGYRRKLSS